MASKSFQYIFNLIQKIKPYFFGTALCFFLALIAEKIAILPFAPFTLSGKIHPISSEIIAILLGIIISNSKKIPGSFNLGIDFTVKDILAIAIILLGAKLNLQYILKSSATIFIIDVASVILNLTIGIWVCHKLQLEKNTALLLVTGNAICGSSAIIVLAPLIKANQNQVSIALIVSSLLGLLAIFIYPILGSFFAINQQVFGWWAGSTVQSVPQVLATGFAFGKEAGETATITKLIKILLLAPTIFIIMLIKKEQTLKITQLHKYIPPFIFGFLIMMLLNSLNFFNPQISHIISIISNLLLTATMVGIGLKTNLKTCLSVATKPLLAGGICFIIIALLMFFLINYL